MDDIQRSALRKTAWRFVPLLTIAYLFNYLDRTCLGFAALTMNKAIGLNAEQFGFGAGVFFLAYSLCEMPSNMAMYRFGARRWIARIMITWGVASAATALVTGPYSFYAVRFLLGVAEAGFFPGITFFLAAWFPAQVRARMLAWFLVGIPLSSVIGGPVCGYLLQFDGVLGAGGVEVAVPGGQPAVHPARVHVPEHAGGPAAGGVVPDPAGAGRDGRDAGGGGAGEAAPFGLGGGEGRAGADPGGWCSSGSPSGRMASSSGCRRS